VAVRRHIAASKPCFLSLAIAKFKLLPGPATRTAWLERVAAQGRRRTFDTSDQVRLHQEITRLIPSKIQATYHGVNAPSAAVRAASQCAWGTLFESWHHETFSLCFVLVHTHDEHGYNKQNQYVLCMSSNNTKHPFKTLFIHCMYLVWTSIEHSHVRCKNCYSTSESRQSDCSTYTPYTHDIKRQIIMPYDEQETSGCQLSKEPFSILDLYTEIQCMSCVCTCTSHVQVCTCLISLESWHPEVLCTS